VRKSIAVGSTVLVRLYDGREVTAKITAIVNGPAGQKIHIAFGAFALKVDPAQIIKEIRNSLASSG
jgi:hypothetical protein